MHAIFISGDHLERGNRTGRLVNNRKGREDSYHLRESTLVLTESFAKTSGNKVMFLFSNLSSNYTILIAISLIESHLCTVLNYSSPQQLEKLQFSRRCKIVSCQGDWTFNKPVILQSSGTSATKYKEHGERRSTSRGRSD